MTDWYHVFLNFYFILKMDLKKIRIIIGFFTPLIKGTLTRDKRGDRHWKPNHISKKKYQNLETQNKTQYQQSVMHCIES